MVSFFIPAIIIGATMALAWPLGRYMRWAMDPEDSADPRKFDPLLEGRISREQKSGFPRRLRYERFCEAVLGRHSARSQNWKRIACRCWRSIW